jgi:Cu(I)/Ag(I) efflux system membrane fusion protein
MYCTELRFTILVVALFGLSMFGCTPSHPAATPSAPTGSDTRGEDMDHGDHDHEGHDDDGAVGASVMDKMEAELAKLPEADRLAAEKQHICPVGGEMLGTMGTPVKVTVQGQEVWLCCEGCKDQLLTNPDKFLAKLPK